MEAPAIQRDCRTSGTTKAYTGGHGRASVYRSILTAFTVAVLPIYLLGFIILLQAEAAVRTEVVQSMRTLVRSSVTSIESDLSSVRILQQELYTDEDLLMLSAFGHLMSDIERIMALRRLSERIQILASLSVLVEDVAIHIPLIDRVLEASDGVNALDRDRLKYLVGVAQRGRLTASNGDFIMLLNSREQYLYDRHTPRFAFEIRFREEALLSTLPPSRMTENTVVALWSVADGWVLETPEGSSRRSAVLWDHIESVSASLTPTDSIAAGTYRSWLFGVGRSSDHGFSVLLAVPRADLFGTVRLYRIWLAATFFVSIFFFVGFRAWTRKSVYDPIVRLAEAFRSMEAGNLAVHLEYQVDNEFAYLYRHFNAMVEELRRLIQEVYEQQSLTQSAELKQLQSQINPHFLYNTFFTMSGMARQEDYQALEQFTDLLGRYFRYVTRNADTEASLAEEVGFSQAYTQIQAIRCGERVSVSFEPLPRELADVVVPRLILQPIVENAFEHGLSATERDGTLTVRFLRRDDRVVIEVIDNGRGIGEEKLDALRRLLSEEPIGVGPVGESTGILNVHRRLRLFFGGRAGIELVSGTSAGLTVRIVLPQRRNQDVSAPTC